jgi:hypothetical protein
VLDPSCGKVGTDSGGTPASCCCATTAAAAASLRSSAVTINGSLCIVPKPWRRCWCCNRTHSISFATISSSVNALDNENRDSSNSRSGSRSDRRDDNDVLCERSLMVVTIFVVVVVVVVVDAADDDDGGMVGNK